MYEALRRLTKSLLVPFLALFLLLPDTAGAASKAEIDEEVQAALQSLYKSSEAAKKLEDKAIAVLVFPNILKGGLVFGAQYGDGALVKDGKTLGYYRSMAASYGLQAGVQKFGYAMFFMTEKAVDYLEKSGGWEVGVGPSIVVVDKETAAAFGKSLSSTTLKEDIYAFIFSQKGLMAGIGLQGSKITKINPK